DRLVAGAAAAAADRPKAHGRGRPPTVRQPPPRARPGAGGPGGRAGRRGRRAAERNMLRVRGRPRNAAPRAPPGSDGRPGRRARRSALRRPPVLEPDLRDRPPAGNRPHLRELRLHARRADASLTMADYLDLADRSWPVLNRL